MFENYRTFSCEIAGRPLVVETGKIAQLANGSALVRYGDTVILATATASAKPRDGIDFLPLSVDFVTNEMKKKVNEINNAINRLQNGYRWQWGSVPLENEKKYIIL